MISFRLARILILLLVTVVQQQASAVDCSRNEGYSADSLRQAKEAAELANATLRHLNALHKFINSRKWEDGKPMDQQMTTAEAEEFGVRTSTFESLWIALLSGCVFLCTAFRYDFNVAVQGS